MIRQKELELLKEIEQFLFQTEEFMQNLLLENAITRQDLLLIQVRKEKAIRNTMLATRAVNQILIHLKQLCNYPRTRPLEIEAYEVFPQLTTFPDQLSIEELIRQVKQNNFELTFLYYN